jgi:hypothetical protein
MSFLVELQACKHLATMLPFIAVLQGPNTTSKGKKAKEEGKGRQAGQAAKLAVAVKRFPFLTLCLSLAAGRDSNWRQRLRNPQA